MGDVALIPLVICVLIDLIMAALSWFSRSAEECKHSNNTVSAIRSFFFGVSHEGSIKRPIVPTVNSLCNTFEQSFEPVPEPRLVLDEI